jgi:acyl-coenzyme A synthetase/AMP-(fatty) acid ligase/uncharacterized membrane protein
VKINPLFYVLAAAYPFIVFIGLVVLKVPLRIFSLALILFGLFFFLSTTAGKTGKKPLPQAFLLSTLGLICLVTNIPLVLKLYPVVISAALLGAFGSTLFSPPSMVYRLAIIMDKSIPGSLGEPRIAQYCRKVTLVWCVFFILNGTAAALPVFFGSERIWVLYNGGIFYGLMAIFFAVEYLIRRMVKKKVPQTVPLSRFIAASREKDLVLCYSESYGGGSYRTWGDFLAGTAVLRGIINGEDSRRWILYCNDYWFFLLAYTALLQCGREVLLTANASPAYIEEISRGGGALITDEKEALALTETGPAASALSGFYVPGLLEAPAPRDAASENPPPINPDETTIVMYTSGTTGQPKQVRQRLREFENDNSFILSKWGGEFLKRKLCSTVSPHHIYGLLFSVMLPFTAGIPFRRERVEFPETFEKLRDDSYMIITVPALLKRSVENREAPFGLNDPWIFTSGGAVPPETAAQTEKLFGFWPVEVYGSTETSGIAWRQSKAGPEWTPFDNAEVSKNEEGCLVIRSPYIKDPAGFTTGDLAELLADGRFLLKGRADSIVKIEEKRISLPEVESRLMQSGLAADAAVTAIQGKRQYLAAALVLNGAGTERFKDWEKFQINRFFREYLARFFESMVIPKRWRYLERLPRNAQGKLQLGEIQALFQSETLEFPKGITGTMLEQSPGGGSFELTVPEDSPYFDGHFSGFKLLPAVAQVELALNCASLLFGPAVMTGAKRIKFSNAVFPGARIRIKTDYHQGLLRFSVSSPDGRPYSSGTLNLELNSPGGEP